jgi:hypothetical protein
VSEDEEESQEAFENQELAGSMDKFKLRALIGSLASNTLSWSGPPSGVTVAVPRFQQDLEALLLLAQRERPILCCMQSNKCSLTVFYGFGNAFSSGFSLSVQRPDGLLTRFGIWPSDVGSESSNYREIRNLVEAVEEEAKVGYLANSEFWLFTDDSTAESCFYKGGLSSKTLHELVLRLKRAELKAEFTLFVVHVAGMRIIAQGTDGLSCGIILEGVMLGKNMLPFVPLPQSARERQPILVGFLQECVGQALQCKVKVLEVEEWFQEGHGIIGGYNNSHGVWIPRHAKNGRVYLWAPPPVIADVALKECIKAVQKRMDAYHIFLIPHLIAPAWLCMFYKPAGVIFTIPVGSPLWPFNMHEPLFVGIALPFIRCRPCSL